MEPNDAGGTILHEPLSAQRTNSPNARATDPRAVPPEVTDLERSNGSMTRRKTALTFDMRGGAKGAKRPL